MAASHYALLHLPNPLHSRHLFFSSPTPRCRLFLAPSSAARPRRASAGPLVFETEEERPGSGWSSATADTPQSDYDDEEEQGWAGGNSAGRGESHEEDGGGGRPRRGGGGRASSSSATCPAAATSTTSTSSSGPTAPSSPSRFPATLRLDLAEDVVLSQCVLSQKLGQP
uniref:Uncharacterized protein n=1 Tax=Oryza brachyantha TaxID=4533 RepID=J3LCE2_ORYBR